jgi:hypothetical protein
MPFDPLRRDYVVSGDDETLPDSCLIEAIALRQVGKGATYLVLILFRVILQRARESAVN